MISAFNTVQCLHLAKGFVVNTTNVQRPGDWNIFTVFQCHWRYYWPGKCYLVEEILSSHIACAAWALRVGGRVTHNGAHDCTKSCTISRTLPLHWNMMSPRRLDCFIELQIWGNISSSWLKNTSTFKGWTNSGVSQYHTSPFEVSNCPF